MIYTEELAKNARLRLLQMLAEKSAYTDDEVALQAKLASRCGHALGRDRVRTELVWLEDQGLLVLQRPGGIMLATLTTAGLEVSGGVGRNPGVAAPGPGE
ncbi:MAG: ArsR family transcriptional regulator [Nitrosomonadales bacterium]|nr:ArsR family transcriptional regulator [Nitrosomonadales bacterium]